MTARDSRQLRPDGGIPAWAERLVLFLDDGFVVPGTKFRVGFDALIGLVPGVGDFVTTASSLSLVWLAHERGASQAVVGRMLINLAIDALVGAVPVAGDLFDVFFKANRRNLELLRRHDLDPKTTRRRDLVFASLVIATILLLLIVPIVLAILIVRLIVG